MWKTCGKKFVILHIFSKDFREKLYMLKTRFVLDFQTNVCYTIGTFCFQFTARLAGIEPVPRFRNRAAG